MFRNSVCMFRNSVCMFRNSVAVPPPPPADHHDWTMPRCMNVAEQHATLGVAARQQGRSTGAAREPNDRAIRAKRRRAGADSRGKGRGAFNLAMSTFALMSCIALAKGTATLPKDVARLMGFGVAAYVSAKERYDQTSRASPEKHKSRGPPRKLSKDKWEELYDELCDNQGDGYRAIALKYEISIATVSRSCGNASSDPNTKSNRGIRCKAMGKIPLTLKVPQVLMSEANMPRVVDMHMSWMEGMQAFDPGLIAYTDECPVFYGPGQHSKKSRAPRGEASVQEKPYRWKRATLCMCVTKFDLIKAVLAGDSWGGSAFRDFVLEESRTPTDEYTNLGGPSLAATLRDVGIRVLAYDMLGRSGISANPTSQHFHPDIKPGLASHDVLGSLGPPKFGIQDPIELVNGLIQDKVRECACFHLAENHGHARLIVQGAQVRKWPSGKLDSAGRELRGPQTLQDVFIAANWAIGECRKDGSLARQLGKAYDERCQGKYATELFEKLTFFDELRRKRAETPRGTPYDIEYMGKIVRCKNLSFRPVLPDSEGAGSEEQGDQHGWISQSAAAPAASTAPTTGTAPAAARHCSKCGHAGHTAPRCPLNTQAAAAASLASPEPAPRGTVARGTRHCSICKQPGHDKRNCQSLQGGSGTSASSATTAPTTASSSTSVHQNMRRQAQPPAQQPAAKRQRRSRRVTPGPQHWARQAARQWAAARASSSSESEALSSSESDASSSSSDSDNDDDYDDEDAAEDALLKPRDDDGEDEDEDSPQPSFWSRAARMGSAAARAAGL